MPFLTAFRLLHPLKMKMTIASAREIPMDQGRPPVDGGYYVIKIKD